MHVGQALNKKFKKKHSDSLKDGARGQISIFHLTVTCFYCAGERGVTHRRLFPATCGSPTGAGATPAAWQLVRTENLSPRVKVRGKKYPANKPEK